MTRRYHWTVDLSFWLEARAGRLWSRIAERRSGGVTAGRVLDEMVTWPQAIRYRQERKHPAGVR